MTDNRLDCDQAQVAISALLDDEDPAVNQEQLANHLDQCKQCAAWQRQAERGRRSLRLQRVQVPDLTESVLAAVAADPRIGQAAAIVRGRRTVLRVGLAIAALAQLLMALPLLSAGPQTPRAEASWEMAAFEIALAVGLFFVAWRPTYARAFVPVSVVLSLGLILGGVRNVSTDPAVLAHNLSYLLAVVQAGLVWSVARGEPTTPDRDRSSQNPPAWLRRIHTMTTRALAPIVQHKNDWAARCRRLLVHLLLGAGIAIGLMAATPSPALAHAVLVRTDPAENALLAQAPSVVTLTFDERVEPVKKAFSVVGPNGKSANTGSPANTDDGKHVSMRLTRHLPQGTYLVSYRVISADGHPVGGGFDFSVGKRSTPPHAASSVNEGGTDPGVRAALSVSKYVGYIGAALAAGSTLMLVVLWPHRLDRRLINRMAWSGWTLLILGAAGQFFVQVPYTAGGGLAELDASGLRSVATSTVGIAFLARIVLVLAAAPFLRALTRDGVVSVLWRWCLLSLGVLAAFTWPIAGHPGTVRGRLIAIASDAVHVTAMALWLGGLIVLVGALLQRAGTSELTLIMPVWSRWALAAVATLGVTGLLSALLTMDGVGPLFHSAYGWLVVAKFIGLCLIITVAFFSRRWVQRRLPLLDAASEETETETAESGEGGENEGSTGEAESKEEPAASLSRIRRLVGLEIGLAVVVLGLATALTQASPRVTASDVPSNAHAGSYTATLRSGNVTLLFELDPGERGNNSLHLTSINAQRNPVPVLEWHASVALPARHIAPVDISLLSLAENHVTGEVSLPSAGKWVFHITARTSDVDEITVDRKVPIS